MGTLIEFPVGREATEQLLWRSARNEIGKQTYKHMDYAKKNINFVAASTSVPRTIPDRGTECLTVLFENLIRMNYLEFTVCIKSVSLEHPNDKRSDSDKSWTIAIPSLYSYFLSFFHMMSSPL